MDRDRFSSLCQRIKKFLPSRRRQQRTNGESLPNDITTADRQLISSIIRGRDSRRRLWLLAHLSELTVAELKTAFDRTEQRGKKFDRFVRNWISRFGEGRHSPLILRTAYSYEQSAIFYMHMYTPGTTEPTERYREIIYRGPPLEGFDDELACRAVAKSYTNPFVEHVLAGYEKNDAFAYGWLQFAINNRRTHRLNRNTLLTLAVTGDWRLVHTCERLVRMERASAKDFADSLQLLGAMQMIVHNDTSACLRLWARDATVAGSYELDLETLEQNSDQLFLQALRMASEMTASITDNRCVQFYMSTLSILENALKRFMAISMSERLEMLNHVTNIYHREWRQRGSNLPYTNKLLRCFGRLLDSPDISLPDIICIEEYLGGHRRCDNSPDSSHWQQCLAKLLRKINLRELAETALSIHTLFELMQAAVDHLIGGGIDDEFTSTVVDDLIPMLLRKGACLNGWSGNVHHDVLRAACSRTSQSIDSHITESRCWCSHAVGCYDRVAPLRCLAARVIHDLPDDFEPQIPIANGRIRVPIQQFLSIRKHIGVVQTV